MLHIAEQEGGTLSATLDSPDQGATGIPVSSISYDPATQQLEWESQGIGAKYQGTLQGDTIEGFFVQRSMPLRLQLTRGDVEPETEVLPYHSQEVEITSGDVTLSGTLTSPLEEGKPVALLLVAGSGANNRNSQIMQHKPLYFIADHLTKEGYSVLRYDKRGVGKSSGTFLVSTLNDFKEDAQAALKYLRATGKYSQVGIVGHSEGGLIAQMIAAEQPESADFIILLAAPGVPGIETIVYQNEVMMDHMVDPQRKEEFKEITEDVFTHIAYDQLDRKGDSLLLRQYFERVLPLVKEEMRPHIQQMVEGDKYFSATLGALTPYYKGFLRTDPKQFLPHITCPILAINGDKDMQVGADANLGAIEALTPKETPVTIEKVEGVNHLFLPAQTGMPQDYILLQPGFSDKVLKLITDWLPNE